MSASPTERSSSPELASTMVGDKNEDDIQQFQQIIRDRRYEREDIQKKAFTKWINNQLADTNSTPPVTDLFQDLRDGVILLQLLEVLTGNECKKENGKMRVHHIGNVNKVIAVLAEHGIKLLSISSNDIVDGNPKLTLALIWSIIQYWQGKDVIKSVENNVEQNNIEKFLLSWCQEQTKGYKGVEINDFTRSWQDGLAFNALIHKFRPDLFDYEEILQNASARNLEHAFSVAKNVFKIDRYLDVEDLTSDFPDKKSILMYVMCLFQQLPASNMIIEDKEKNEISTTTIVTDDNSTATTEIKPSPTENETSKERSEEDSIRLKTYQTSMERILQWVLKLEDDLDKQDTTISNDLKTIKDQFQNHEEFMISLTQDQNQIGEILLEGNQLLTTPTFHLQTDEDNDIKEQMKILNDHWELLRSKSLDRQTILHKALMKLQVDQIESFDAWLSQTEQRITVDLSLLEQNLSGINRQYEQLAQLQDELVSQQQITESLQNMIIVIDDSPSDNSDSPSTYNSTEIETKLANLSERWAQICNFVQNRWVLLQELKVEFEQIDTHLEKVNKWLISKENEINQMKSQPNINNSDILMQQVHSIQKTESEMTDIRQSIIVLDNSIKLLSQHYDSTTSNEFKILSEQINNFEKRWTQLIDDLEQYSARLKTIDLTTETHTKSDNDLIQKTITTTIEETTTTTYEESDDSIKKSKDNENENIAKLDFDVSARKYIDWIDSIERILDEKPLNQVQIDERQNIIQEVKTKYLSYDDQFKTLIQTGNIITKELKDANEDSNEHETSLKTLESRWQELYKQIVNCEKDLEQSKFNEEFQALNRARSQYQTWIDSTSSNDELQVQLNSFQAYNERLANLRRMADRFDGNNIQRTDDLLRSWDETHSRLRERTIPVEHMQQQSSGIASSSSTSFRQTGVSSVPASPNRIASLYEQSSSSASAGGGGCGGAGAGAGATNLGQSIGENGSVFTLTNIYTFGGQDGNSNNGLSNDKSDKYRINSFVEVFNQPSSQHDSEYERHYRETHSSSSITRKIRTSATDSYDYEPNGNYDSSHYQHQYETGGPSSTKYIHEQKSSGTGNLSLLPSTFVDTQNKLRLWLEHVEQSLLSDKVRIIDIHAINAKKKVYKDLLDQTFEQEHNLEILNDIAREYYCKLTTDVTRRLQGELTNYHERLSDIKMFLSERLAKYNRLDKTLSDFESGIEEVKLWIRNAQPRVATSDTSSRGLENQLGRHQVLQHEIRETQTIVNRLNKDVIDLTQDADEHLARRLRDEMNHLNESWSHIVSSTKVYSQNIQDTLKRNKILQEEIRDLQEWIIDRDRSTFFDDGSICHQDQIRERLEQYQRLQTELNLKEYTVRTLVEQARHDISQNSSPELAQSLETLISNWSTLQKKVDTKVIFYSDIYKLHEELKDLLYRENIWLDTLQNRIYAQSHAGVDAEETAEELETIERFIKSHSRINYERIIEISDRLQATKVSLPSINSQINQFHIRWEQLHDDAIKRIHVLNSHVSDHQQLNQQIAAMFEWIRLTDNTLNSRLKDDVYADDVPGEAEKLILEFNQYEAFLYSIEDKIHALRSTGKSEAARRLEQQFLPLKNQFTHLQGKFRQFQKPSDFEPKYARMRQILHDVEQNLYTLEIRSDDPDVVHNQLEHCIKVYKTLSDIKSEVEYVIRIGRGVVEKGQTEEANDLTRQIDQLKATYNNLGAKVSTAKTQLDSVERHLRKFRKEYSHIHEWYVKADHEIRKIENKQVSKNTKEEVDWIRTTRNDIKKLEANFESLRTLERTIQKDAERHLPNLQEKIHELKRQIDHLDQRLRDRSGIVEDRMRIDVKRPTTSSHSERSRRYHNLIYIPFESGCDSSSGISPSSSTTLSPVEYIIYPIGLRKDQVRRLEDDYQRFVHIYQGIIIRLDKLESLLLDAERVTDLTRISQVQEELRSVRTQLDEILNLGQELVSKSEKYSKLVGPDIETITRKFEELQHRIHIIQETQEKRTHQQQQTSTTSNATTTATTTAAATNNIPNDQADNTRREYYSEKRYNRTERQTHHRSPSESSDVSTAHGVIDEEFKKKYLRCLAYMKLIERLYENQPESDEDSDMKHQRLSRRERTIRDRPEYEEIERIIRETEERAYIIEKTDVEQARRIREKILRLRDCLESLKTRSEQYQNNDEIIRFNERYEEHIRTADRTVAKERDFDSDFIFDMDDTRSVISEPAPHLNTKYRKTVHSLERYRNEDQSRYIPTHEEYQLQPLLRVRSLKAIDHRTLSAPSSPILQPRYRSYERSNVQYTKQSANQQGHQDNYQSSISKSASMPNGGFPLQQNFLPPPPPPNFYHQQPITYRERIIDKHVAEKSTSRGESHRQQHQESSGHVQQQQQQARSASANANTSSSGQTQTLNRSIPVRYETSNGNATLASTGSFRQTNGHTQEEYPSYFHSEQHAGGGGGSSGGGGSHRQQFYEQQQQTYSPQNVGRHPTRIAN
ncbi:unnamed protein product [Adineta steineri]|uniref:Calponin-homology (CH) domain-containing protein n=1 Tax=Adineta steineri TaxID=433720 RepID=A0A818SKS3_9BILA|nr:unnamed protein product [Adineta steineri]